MRCLILTQQPDKPEKNLISSISKVYDTTIVASYDLGISTNKVFVKRIRSKLDIGFVTTLGNDYEITICFDSKTIPAGLFLKLIGRTKKVVAYRGTTSRLDLSAWISFKNPYLDIIVANCKAVKQALVDCGVPEGKIVVIYKGHSPSWYSETDSAEGGDFVTVLNFRDSKGLNETVRFVNDFFPESSLTVYGMVPEEIKRRHSHSKVIFAGFVEDCYRFLPNYKVFILLSRQEGVPKAAVEASMKGLPIILSPVGGIPEIWDRGCILLSDPYDQRKINLVRELLVYDETRYNYGMDARNCCLEKLNYEHYLNSFLKLIDDLMAK